MTPGMRAVIYPGRGGLNRTGGEGFVGKGWRMELDRRTCGRGRKCWLKLDGWPGNGANNQARVGAKHFLECRCCQGG